MLYQIKSYFNFLRHATNQHGVHSPFVYNLVTKCFYDNHHYEAYGVMDRYRNQLYGSKESITVKDFGAGSKVFKGEQRPISGIAKNVGIAPKRQYLLYRLANYFQPDTMLELGTSLGMGTLALGLGYPRGRLTSVEGCPNTADKAKSFLEPYAIAPEIINQEFEGFFKGQMTIPYDLVYLDGHHEKDATLSMFHQLIDGAHNDSLFIFDDIHWSQGMTDAWNTIVQDERVTVSIDTFHWGLVFFRKEQPKQHFKIRL